MDTSTDGSTSTSAYRHYLSQINSWLCPASNIQNYEEEFLCLQPDLRYGDSGWPLSVEMESSSFTMAM
jgi:hypothetical protein